MWVLLKPPLVKPWVVCLCKTTGGNDARWEQGQRVTKYAHEWACAFTSPLNEWRHTYRHYKHAHTLTHTQERQRDGWQVMKYGFLLGLATLKQPLMKYPLLYLVYRIKTLHYMPLSHLLTRVYVCVCAVPKGIKVAPLTGLNPRKHSFITLMISPSLFPFFIESHNFSQRFTLYLHSSLCVNEWSPCTPYASPLLPQLSSFHCSHFLSLHFYFPHSPITSIALSHPPFHSLAIYSRFFHTCDYTQREPIRRLHDA